MAVANRQEQRIFEGQSLLRLQTGNLHTIFFEVNVPIQIECEPKVLASEKKLSLKIVRAFGRI